MRQVLQELMALELRELKVELCAITGRLNCTDERSSRMNDGLEQIITNGFEGIRRQLDTYNDVQQLKERVIRMEAERGIRPAV